ncbi:hypothetical protein ACXYTJ_17200 [Gilvimarinus sp. F26214L]|uniref:hypothetical protein n=1 Tax=Gilvimarinus sp. DZF01 TaxID=3461371 RepID=UPI004045D193
MDTTKHEYNVEPSKALEMTWYFIGFCLLALGAYALADGAGILLPGIVGLTALVFQVGAQRNARFAIPEARFQRRVIVLSMLIAVYCGAVASTFDAL